MISINLFDRIRQVADDSGFNSVEEFVNYVLEELLINAYGGKENKLIDDKEKETEIASREATIQKFQVTMVGPEGELYRRQAQLEFDILSKVKRAVDKVAATKSIDFILDGSTSLLYGNPTHDLTDDVLFELRKYNISDKKEAKPEN